MQSLKYTTPQDLCTNLYDSLLRDHNLILPEAFELLNKHRGFDRIPSYIKSRDMWMIIGTANDLKGKDGAFPNKDEPPYLDILEIEGHKKCFTDDECYYEYEVVSNVPDFVREHYRQKICGL